MDRAAARHALEENEHWYHTLELVPGVVTPGKIDLRPLTPRALPAEMNGRRALDVGTFDGHWAFEMEKRGAAVVATDVERVEGAEWPPIHRERLEKLMRETDAELGRGFRIAAQAFDSNVERKICNVYSLEPDAIGGMVDFAIVGALLLHLRDPVGALERVRSVLAPGGEVRLIEPFSPWLTLISPRKPSARFRPLESNFSWWLPNRAALWAWLVTAGFKDVRRIAMARPPAPEGKRQWLVVLTGKSS